MLKRKPFYFVRHGQTSWNERKLCQGHTDIPLNETGREEARSLAELASQISFGNIYSSPLNRALETAQIIHSKFSNSQLIVIEELKERKWGELEGGSHQDMFRIEQLEEENFSYSIGNGIEERGSFKSRVSQGINKTFDDDSTPLIVSHGRFFLVLCELLGIPLIRQIPNTSLIKCIPSTTEAWEINFIK